MKLYTEEELRKAYIEGHRRGWSRAVYMHTGRTNKDADEFLNENELTSVELPTYEEIVKELFYQKQVMNPYPTIEYAYTAYEKGFMDCANLIIDKIKGGNK